MALHKFNVGPFPKKNANKVVVCRTDNFIKMLCNFVDILRYPKQSIFEFHRKSDTIWMSRFVSSLFQCPAKVNSSRISSSYSVCNI